MFIRVKYGDDETLLCNTSCTIVNLLASITTRSGHADGDVVVDLTDETGFFYICCTGHHRGCVWRGGAGAPTSGGARKSDWGLTLLPSLSLPCFPSPYPLRSIGPLLRLGGMGSA